MVFPKTVLKLHDSLASIVYHTYTIAYVHAYHIVIVLTCTVTCLLIWELRSRIVIVMHVSTYPMNYYQNNLPSKLNSKLRVPQF